MRSLLVLLFVAVAFFATGEALKCYSCSAYTKACQSDFKKDGTGVFTIDCPMYFLTCAKTTNELSNGTTVIVRGCNLDNTVDRAAERASDVTVLTSTTHYCKEDLCNGVSATSATLSTLIVLAVPFVFSKYH